MERVIENVLERENGSMNGNVYFRTFATLEVVEYVTINTKSSFIFCINYISLMGYYLGHILAPTKLAIDTYPFP